MMKNKMVSNNDILAEVRNLNCRFEEVSELNARKCNEIAGNYNYYRKIIEQQDKIIEDLLNGFKNDNSFECIAFVPYRGKPVIIKNGEVVSTENMTSFDIDWSYDRKTDVTINNE